MERPIAIQQQGGQVKDVMGAGQGHADLDIHLEQLHMIRGHLGQPFLHHPASTAGGTGEQHQGYPTGIPQTVVIVEFIQGFQG